MAQEQALGGNAVEVGLSELALRKNASIQFDLEKEEDAQQFEDASTLILFEKMRNGQPRFGWRQLFERYVVPNPEYRAAVAQARELRSALGAN